MRQVSFDFLGNVELEAFVHASGGTTSKSKSEYIPLLPEFYEIIIRMCSSETGILKTGSFTYYGWSARLGEPIAGMTSHYIEIAWSLISFPLCFLNTEDMCSTGDEHQAIISSVIANNDKLSLDTVIMAGTSDNNSATALGVEQYLDYSGAMRCICNSISSAVNDASSKRRYFTNLLNKIIEITK